MASRGRTPERRGDVRTWSIDKCPGGYQETGHLAGPIHWLECHDAWPTRPCLKKLGITDRLCPGCEKGVVLYDAGYTPLRRHDGRRMCVVLRESQFPIADKIGLSGRVIWGRNKGVGENTWVLPWDSGPTWFQLYGDERADADLTLWLPVLWSMEFTAGPLRRYFASQCQGTVTAAPVEPPADPFPVDAPPELLARDRERRAQLAAREGRLVNLEDALPRLKPGTNGTH